MIFNRLIIEEINKYINNIIYESQESKSQAKAKRFAIQNGMSDDEAENFIREKLRNNITNLRNLNAAKFTLGCTRLYFENNLDNAPRLINLLNNIIKLISSKYIDNFDKNLNGLSLDKLNNQFSDELEEIEQQNRKDVNSKTYKNQGYKIIPIDTFEDAKSYYKYTYKKSPWCITYINNMWERYTQNGNNQVYFCLKDGFENINPPKVLDGNFKDEYGLSMISVIVDENNNLAYSTTRWNYANNASGEQSLTVQEISEIVGVNFYNTFKPNHKWEEMVLQIKQRLVNGEDPKNVFDGCGVFNKGFTMVELNGKRNFIDTHNRILSDIWFDNCWNFNDNGFAKVWIKQDTFYIDTKGKLHNSIE